MNFGESRHPLEVFFAPRSVAVIGATERDGSIGRTVMGNLVTNPFGGTVLPINPKRGNVLGIRCWPSVTKVSQKIDLAVVATPAPAVPGVIRECAAVGIRGAIIISAGFKESGAEGARLEQEILVVARAGRMRIVGPNCLGIMSPMTGLNATFAGAMARKGDVAFLSQSGALQTAILDWSLEENIGFSAFASLGSMLDVGWGDLIDYLDHDGRTESILIYMESIGDARAFLSAAREVTLRKPIIVLKGGRTPQAAQAAASHTGALTGSDEVLTAAFRRTCVLRVDSIADLFYMADTLAKQPRASGCTRTASWTAPSGRSPRSSARRSCSWRSASCRAGSGVRLERRPWPESDRKTFARSPGGAQPAPCLPAFHWKFHAARPLQDSQGGGLPSSRAAQGDCDDR
jgi:acetyltransferase